MMFAEQSNGKDIGPPKTRPRSDHFDGKRFFNPTLPKDFAPLRWSTLKKLRKPRSRWPACVENKGVPRLNEMLGVNEVATTFFNHATFLIQTGAITILTDPVWSERASTFRRIGPKRVRKPGMAFEDVPKIDIVLLSHNHYDHMDVATLTQLRQRFAPTVLAAAGDARTVGPLGFKNLRELDWWDEIQFNDTLKVTFVPAQDFSARSLFDRQRS
ncbi:MAG TPA: MBL fold metallo-hydrolase, partial [Xanthobacteraceae bacterium]|nr:MBL fold metallo-hydrolase [Xanthobacteraceae bacterium]